MRIDGRRGDWSDIEALWVAGDLRDDDFEDRFIDEVIVADIGEGTDGWEFSGARTQSSSGDIRIGAKTLRRDPHTACAGTGADGGNTPSAPCRREECYSDGGRVDVPGIPVRAITFGASFEVRP
ncbi:hypothetical protein [Streptomyces avermitilis]|uniref:hypothetical protein n=1 Tax=Streptomyces avermitilis TaxID=33903 RepID=UPI003802DC29